MTARRAALSIAVLALALAPAAARAQATTDSAAVAEKLFREGRDALNAGRLDEACPKLAESHRLDPGVGTLLNLGDCYVRAGKIASAWATYGECETLARRSSQRDRAQFCAGKVEELAPRLPYLTLRTTTIPSGMIVARDGQPVGQAAWGTAVPVDPGEHAIEASAPGHEPHRAKVTLAPGQRLEVTLPALAKSRVATGPGPTPPPKPPPREAPGWPRTLGWVVAGTGVAAGVTGLVLGGVAKSKNDGARADHCSQVDCDPAGVDGIRQAKTFADLSTAFVIGGSALAVGGVVIVLVAPTGTRASAVLGPGTVGIRGEM